MYTLNIIKATKKMPVTEIRDFISENYSNELDFH